MKDRLVKTGWHWSFGYLRVPDKDEENTYAYESPEGRLVMSTMPLHKHRMYMAQWQDAETGEMYVTDDPAPRVYTGRFRAWPPRPQSGTQVP